MSGKSGANALEVIEGRDGRAFVAVDSLVTLFDDLAAGLSDDEKSHRTFAALAESLRPVSSFAEVETHFANPSPVDARRCDCGVPVIDGVQQDGLPVVVNARPSHRGEFVPVDRPDGSMTMVPWQERFDGSGFIRLTHHKCVPPLAAS